MIIKGKIGAPSRWRQNIILIRSSCLYVSKRFGQGFHISEWSFKCLVTFLLLERKHTVAGQLKWSPWRGDGKRSGLPLLRVFFFFLLVLFSALHNYLRLLYCPCVCHSSTTFSNSGVGWSCAAFASDIGGGPALYRVQGAALPDTERTEPCD